MVWVRRAATAIGAGAFVCMPLVALAAPASAYLPGADTGVISTLATHEMLHSPNAVHTDYLIPAQ